MKKKTLKLFFWAILSERVTHGEGVRNGETSENVWYTYKFLIYSGGGMDDLVYERIYNIIWLSNNK